MFQMFLTLEFPPPVAESGTASGATAASPLTFPLVELQVCVVHGLIIGQRFCLLVNVSELGEEI